jgi:hypothetical protein
VTSFDDDPTMVRFRAPGSPRVNLAVRHVLLGRDEESWQTLELALAEAAEGGHRLRAMLLVRPSWWFGVGAAAGMLHGGYLVLDHLTDELRMDYGLALIARGHDGPVVATSTRQLCERARQDGVERVLTSPGMARGLRRPLARCGVALDVG